MLLNVLVAVLEAVYDRIHDLRLVEREFLGHVLQEDKRCLSDRGSIINIVLEGSQIDLGDKLLLDWSLKKSDCNQSINFVVEQDLEILVENDLAQRLN